MCVGWGADCSAPPIFSNAPDANFETMVNFIPAEFLADGDNVRMGSLAGYVSQNVTLGLLNGPCMSTIPLAFSLMKASVNQSSTVSTKPAGAPDVFEPLARDENGNGVPDGADSYPSYLTEYLEGLQPLQRLFGVSKVQGAWMTYNVLIFGPGAHIVAGNLDAVFDPALGHPMLFVLRAPNQPSRRARSATSAHRCG